MPNLLFDDIQTVRDTTNAAVRTIREVLDSIPYLKDFNGFDATDIYTALTNALTDVDTVYLGPGAYALNTNYTIASGKTVVLLPGAVLTVNSGKTLTCTGVLLRFVTGQLVATGTVSGSGKLLVTTTNA